ncbi:NDP-sugar synthase [Candidatus Micrarchaeota archaeon]|nr:NDP-sugar synthase [Candidatus Micrarchaeota archaeon]
MKALLLAGGYGIRLYPITLRTPKVLLPVAGKPVIQHQIEMLKAAGIGKVIISLNKNQKRIEEYFGEGSRFGVKIDYYYEHSTGDEDKPGAIGAIHQVTTQFGVGDYLILGSDNFIHGLDLRKMMEFHEEKKAHITLSLYQTDNRYIIERNGMVGIDSNGKVKEFQEKPRIEYAISNLVSPAAYIWGRQFVEEHLPKYVEERKKMKQKPDMIGHVYQYYANKIPIYGFKYEGVWGDVGTPETYIEINRLAFNLIPPSSGKAGKGVVIGKQVQIGKNVEIGKRTVIRGPVIIEDKCKIAEDSVIGPYVYLIHDSQIGSKSFISSSVVFERSRIGDGVHAENCIIDGEAVIEDDSRIEGYAMIGYQTKAGKGSRILGNSKLWPRVELKNEAVIEGEIQTPIEYFSQELESSCFWK